MSQGKFKFSDRTTLMLMSRLYREAIYPYFGRILLAVVFMAIVAACLGATAWLMEVIVDEVLKAHDKERLWWVAGTVLVLFSIKNVSEITQSILMNHVGLRVIADLQNRLFAHLMRMDVPFFHSHSSGSLVSRFTTDIAMMRFAAAYVITSLGKDFLSVLSLIIVMFRQDYILASAAFFVFPLGIYPIVRLGKRMRKVTINTQEQVGALTTALDQSFHGNRMVKAYGLEDYERGKVESLTETIYKLTMKGAINRSLASPMMDFLGGVAVAVVIIYGGSRVIAEVLTPGQFFSFITALMMAYRPMKSLANLNTNLQEGLAGTQRLFSLLDLVPEITEKPNATALTVTKGHIALDRVSFSYDGQTPALTELSLEAPPGKTVALVGPSGAGKSTLLNLIPRFFDVREGVVRIDGVDVRDVTFASLRGHIALVSQEITLFDDTVRANIAYGRPEASEAEILDAARHAAADEFIRELPQGYDTRVGQRGLNLSGGQRQRVAIARAMLKNAPILLLDEATSALDTESERKVQAALEELMHGRTTIVIAHRLSTVVNADLIHVIDRGRLVESGTHEALLAQGGHYANLYQLQFAAEANEGASG